MVRRGHEGWRNSRGPTVPEYLPLRREREGKMEGEKEDEGTCVGKLTNINIAVQRIQSQLI